MAISSSRCASSKITVLVGKHRAVGRTHREIGEEQVMVDDDDLRLLSASLEPRQPALLVLGATRAAAGVGPRVEIAPQLEAVGKIGLKKT